MLNRTYITLRRDIGRRIKAWRRAAGKTQLELSDEVLVDRGTLIAIEKGKGNVTLKVLDRICVGLGKTVEDIFTKEDEEDNKGPQ